MKLSPKALGMTFGSLWGLTLFFCTLWASQTGTMEDMLTQLVGVYPWYTVTPSGAFIGLVLAFLDGLVGGAILAWVYNKFLEVFAPAKPAPRMAAPTHKKRPSSAKKSKK